MNNQLNKIKQLWSSKIHESKFDRLEISAYIDISQSGL